MIPIDEEDEDENDEDDDENGNGDSSVTIKTDSTFRDNNDKSVILEEGQSQEESGS